jgi:peptidoglycan/xylan/chitin deacetylase (PgdA/CDA1 family)
MKAPVRPLWRALPRNWEQKLDACLEQAASCKAAIFFRDDDAAAESKNFLRMLEIFERHGTCLDIAVVPTWLTAARAEALLQDVASPLFGLHQHGFRHVNHEVKGKKCEFGPGRPALDKQQDILRGKRRLEELLGDRFQPIFSPPWNRVDAETLDILFYEGFDALSRFRGAKPATPSGLAALDANVDLHTRKEPGPEKALDDLLGELLQALREGLAGIMLHHQVMNDAAFLFLNRLLQGLANLRSAVAAPMARLAPCSNKSLEKGALQPR